MPENSSIFTGEFDISEDFSVPDFHDWELLAESSLRGADLKSLSIDLLEGFPSKVLYTGADSQPDPGIPGFSPFLRAREVSPSPWKSCALIDDSDIEKGLKNLEFALSRDVTAIWLQCADIGQAEKPGLPLESLEDFKKLLEAIDPDGAEILLDAGGFSAQAAIGLLSASEDLGIDYQKLRGSFGFDPMGYLACKGSLQGGLKNQREIIAGLALWAEEHCKGMRTLCLSSLPYEGASAVEELGLLLGATLDALRFLTAAGMRLDAAASSILYRMSIGADFFIGIAKFRALRQLWDSMSSHCGLDGRIPPPIHAVTSLRNLTRRDPWVNLLRGSVETFAAIAGGANLITTRSFDSAFQAPDTLGRRLALNTQTILREESHLEHIVDPGGGSWYIETLTRRLAEGAWAFFREIEGKGGMEKCLRSGMIQDRIEEKEESLRVKIATREIPITGVSTWALPQREIPPKRKACSVANTPAQHLFSGPDWVPDALRAASKGTAPNHMRHPDGGIDPPIRPLKAERKSEAFEDLQDRTAILSMDNQENRVLLLRLGKPADFTAREGFSINFFTAAGIQTESTGGFEHPEDAARAAIESGLSRVCLCSSDTIYQEMAPTILPLLRNSGIRQIFLAGMPGEMESEWRALGLDDFIYKGCNVLDFLSRLIDTMEAGR